MFANVFQLIPSQLPGFPSFGSAAAELIISLIMLPEAILLGLLISMLRLRVKGDRSISGIDCAPLKMQASPFSGR